MPSYSPGTSSGYSNIDSIDPRKLSGSGQIKHLPTSRVQFGAGGEMPSQVNMDWNKYSSGKNQLRNLVQNYDQGPTAMAMGNLGNMGRQDNLRAMSQAPQMSMRDALNQGVQGGMRQDLGRGMQQNFAMKGQRDQGQQRALQNLFGIGTATGKAKAGDVMARQGLRDNLSHMDQVGHQGRLDYEAGKALQNAQERAAHEAKMGGRRKLFGTIAGGIAGSFAGQPMLGAQIGGSAMGAWT